MVEITPVEPEEEAVSPVQALPEPEPKPSEERLLDAEAIETAAKTIHRPTARAHLESLAQKLRRDAAALKRVESSRAKAEEAAAASSGDVGGVSAPAPASAAASAAPSPAPAVAPPKPPARPVPAPHPAAPSALSKFTPIDRFAFDAGGYDSAKVTIYVPLPGIGSIPRDRVACEFTPASFDLVVRDLGGKNYRLVKDNLEKDIDPATSKYIVKADKIVIKLGKCKTDYGSYDQWLELTSKKSTKKKAGEKEDPSASIMNMMKNMYDEGDDNMKRMIGETMQKQRDGKLGKEGMGGMGDLGGMGDMGL